MRAPRPLRSFLIRAVFVQKGVFLTQTHYSYVKRVTIHRPPGSPRCTQRILDDQCAGPAVAIRLGVDIQRFTRYTLVPLPQPQSPRPTGQQLHGRDAHKRVGGVYFSRPRHSWRRCCVTDIEHPPHTKFVFYKLLYIKNLLCQPLTRKNFNRLRFMDFGAFFRPKTLHSLNIYFA